MPSENSKVTECVCVMGVVLRLGFPGVRGSALEVPRYLAGDDTRSMTFAHLLDSPSMKRLKFGPFM